MLIPWVLSSTTVWAQEEFDELRVLIEINATDGDAGFQAKGDAEGWREVQINSPDDDKLFSTRAFNDLREQGLTEIFFESEEPSCDEVPLLEFLERFPMGEYIWTGKMEGGETLEGEAILTHYLPGAPAITGPGDVEAETPAIVNPSNPVQITWEEGEGFGECDPGEPFEIMEPEELFGFQVVVEREEPEPLMVLSIDLPNGTNSLTIPSEFLEDEAIYKFEVIAIEAREPQDEEDEVERGNQTISEFFFCTTGVANCELPE
jgi:hypothetical protein